MHRVFIAGLLFVSGASIAAEPGAGAPQVVAVEQAVELLRGEAVAVDVRTQEEWSAGHLKEALHVPVSGIRENAAHALKDKDRVLLLYCGTGARALVAAGILEEQGYRKLYVLKPGGFTELKASGVPVE